MKVQKKMVIYWISGAALLLLGAYFLQFFIGDGTVLEKYSSYSEAYEREALAHGMIPDFLPKSATRIISERDVESDTLIAEFTYGEDFDEFVMRSATKNMSIPMSVLDGTSLEEVSADLLRLHTSRERGRECTSHLVVNVEMRQAVYVYNLAPHKAGCLESY